MAVTERPAVSSIAANLPALATDRLLLRKMTLDDAPALFAYAKDPAVSRYTLWNAHASVEDSLRFLRCIVANYQAGIIENWGIVLRENNTFIGTCGFFDLSVEHRRAHIQYALSGDYSGRGLMTEAVNEIIRFGFKEMGLHRIAAECMTDNAASEKVMQKAGMKFEGIMKEAVFKNGFFHDLKAYAIVRGDWLNVHGVAE